VIADKKAIEEANAKEHRIAQETAVT